MPTNKAFSRRKIKELTVDEFISLMDQWSDRQKDNERSTNEEFLKGRRELCKFLGCSLTTVYRNMREGLFEEATHKIGGTYYFDKSVITAIRSKRRQRHAAR